MRGWLQAEWQHKWHSDAKASPFPALTFFAPWMAASTASRPVLGSFFSASFAAAPADTDFLICAAGGNKLCHITLYLPTPDQMR